MKDQATKYPTDPRKPKRTAAVLHKWGANVIALKGKSAELQSWGKWKTARQSPDEAGAIPWGRATGVGVISGVNEWRCLDIDDLQRWGIVEQILDAWGFPHSYPWVVQSGSGEGAHIWFRCTDDERFAGCDNYLPKTDGTFDHLEVRWKNHQTAVPPSIHPATGDTYTFPHGRPDRAPWEIDPDDVEAGLKAVARPKKSRSTSKATSSRAPSSDDGDNPSPEKIRRALDALPDGYGDDYDDWTEIIRAVQAGTEDNDTAEKLLKEWRDEWKPGEYGRKLETFDPAPADRDGTTVRTLFGIAKDYGFDPSEQADATERVESVVEKIETDGAGAGIVFENLDAFARLDTADFAVAKEKVSDVVNLNDFTRAVREKERELERRDFEEGSDLPTIQLSGRPGREIVDEATEALHDWNDPPELFQRGTDPVQVATDDEDRPIIRELPDAVLDDCLDRAADFFRSTEKRGAIREDLSKRYVERIRDTIDLPSLGGIVEVPVLREDGSILDNPGYDEQSCLYYQPDAELTVPDIPRNPTEEQVEEARRTIWKPIQDFPFVDEASAANALALMLTPIIRPHIGAQNVPMALVDATVQGTGKTLFVTVVSTISTGRTAATMSAPDSAEEWRKQITAQLLKGASMIVVDNVRGRLQSAPLEQALTTSLWQDRVLGKSKQAEIPQRATWIATGNNIQPKGDMKRRVYPIRMDAEMERPWMGREFEIDNLEAWTKEHRGELVSALLTLARSWFADGAPEPDVELLGSFEQWTRTVGGILEHAGVDGFLGNLGELYEQMNEETAEWAGFLEALHNYFAWKAKDGSRDDPSFTSKELGQLIRENYHGDPKLRGS